MSVISDVVFVCSCAEKDDDREILALLNLHLVEAYDDRDVAGFAQVDGYFGGNKHSQTFTAAASVNYLDEDKFAARVMSSTWRYPENVVLVIQPEDGATKVFRPPGY